MTVTEDIILTDHDVEVLYGVVHKEPGAIIIPWDGDKFTLVGQYRYAVDRFSWEFPAGHLEHDSIIETAKSELQEEAGITANKIEEIGIFDIAPGHLTQICHVFLATDLTHGDQKLERSEKGMETKQVTIAELETMIKKSELRDGLTISALQIFKLHRANK